MNPFTEPFTAPDGTTRRPLSERVPECVPKVSVPTYAGIYIIPEDPEGGVRAGNEAIWRCSLEDWLLREQCPVEYQTMASDRHCISASQIECEDDWPDVSVEAETMNEALNAAAHAVADARGVPV